MEKDTKNRVWRVLRSEYLIKRPWLTARRDELELPDGRIIPEYYVLEYPDWVNIIAIDKEGRMILVRQYRHGLQRTNFELVAGVLEKGEDSMTAARRELLEETGYAGGEWYELMQVSANTSTMTNLTHCFVAVGVEKVSVQHLDATEDLEVYTFTQDEVKEMIRHGEFMQALMVAPLLRYFSGI